LAYFNRYINWLPAGGVYFANSNVNFAGVGMTIANNMYLLRICILLMLAGYFYGWYWAWKIQNVMDEFGDKLLLSILAPVWFSVITGVAFIIFAVLISAIAFSLGLDAFGQWEFAIRVPGVRE